MDWLKKAPTAVTVTVIIMCGVIAVAVLVSFTYLTATGHDTAEFRMWINTIGQILVFPFLGVTAVASVAAARSSSNAEDQTNGQLTAAHNKADAATARAALANAELERSRDRDAG